jgi:TPR repeat protein
MYENGVGVLKDDDIALMYFQKAADQGNAEAMYKVGSIILIGNSIARDYAKAVRYLQKSADQGNADAQGSLATMYENGEILPKDYDKALIYWQKAAAQGNAKGQNGLAYMYSEGKGVQKDDKKAAEWYEKSAQQGYANAQHSFGFALWLGIGITKNSTLAAQWWKLSADQGDKHAQLGLGLLFYKGEGVPKDLSIAAEWFQKAANQGLASAQTILATLYLNGNGVPKNEYKAADWYLKAATQGNALAQAGLGTMYLNGIGVNKDYVIAYAWSNLAAAQGDETGQLNRNTLELQITSEQRTEAQQLSSNWKVGEKLSNPTLDNTTVDNLPNKHLALTGTAFIINREGYAITNYHITHNCNEVRVAGLVGSIQVISSDSENDLALLQLPNKVNTIASFISREGKLRQGDEILVLGYPLHSVLSSSGNITPGIISSMIGVGNNKKQIQITAPIQPGSSGSPVLNKKGDVVGMVSTQLNDAVVARATGSIPQNVNFAINERTLKTFLETNKVTYKTASVSSKEKSNADIAEAARKWTVIVECWK